MNANRRELKNKTPELRFPEFTGAWVEKRLGAILRSRRLGGNYSTTLDENLNLLIKMGNIGRGNIRLNGRVEYINSSEQIDANDEAKYGDLFFNTRNTLDLVGKVAIWRGEERRIGLSITQIS